jgi:hypothetical protein
LRDAVARPGRVLRAVNGASLLTQQQTTVAAARRTFASFAAATHLSSPGVRMTRIAPGARMPAPRAAATARGIHYQFDRSSKSWTPAPSYEDNGDRVLEYAAPPSSSSSSSSSRMVSVDSVLRDVFTLLSSKVPKGFGKFYPEGERPAAIDDSDGDAEKGGKSTEKTFGTKNFSLKIGRGDEKGKKNKDKNDENENETDEEKEKREMEQKTRQLLFGLLGTGALFAMLYEPDGQASQEIAWHEFVTRCLEPGVVKELRVVSRENQSTVRVYLSDNGRAPGVEDGDYAYYFSIGSVDGFERKLEDAEYALDIAPADAVPVRYVTDPQVGAITLAFLVCRSFNPHSLYFSPRGVVTLSSFMSIITRHCYQTLTHSQ